MIEFKNISLQLGKRTIFNDVNLKFESGNCYGIIGGNGGGKTTLLRLILGEVEPTEGKIEISPDEKISCLDRNHYAFSEKTLLDTVTNGSKNPADIESAKQILIGLGVRDAKHLKLMVEVSPVKQIRTMLARALFGNPTVLLLDDPTQFLDIDSARWFENFMLQFKGTAIIVSHDRHFLNRVCTHICDVEIGSIELFRGNFNSWRAGRIVQADFKVARPEQIESDRILLVDNLEKSIDGSPIISKVSFTIKPGEKVAFVGGIPRRIEMLFQILAGEEKIFDSGIVEWDKNARIAYLPKNYAQLFDGSNLAPDERAKEMLKRTMSMHANVLILHEPTANLDLESITALNESLINFNGTILFNSSDREFVQSIANRIIDLPNEGTIDRISTYSDFLANESVKSQLRRKYRKKS